MKKTIIAVFLTAMLMFTSCGTERAADSPSSDSDAENTASTTAKKTEKAVKDVYEIKEKLFIATCNAIYMEPESYMDKPIKLEGYCDIYEDESGVTHYGVIRNGPGCCGNDALAGFEFTFDDEYPAINDWIEVIGMLHYTDEETKDALFIKADSVSVMTVRGNDTVES